MKQILFLLSLLITTVLSAQTEYWKFSYEFDFGGKEPRSMKGDDFTMELYFGDQRYCRVGAFGSDRMNRTQIVDSVAGRKLILQQFGDLKEYTLCDLSGNEIDPSGTIIGKETPPHGSIGDRTPASVEGEAFTFVGDTKQQHGLTLYKITFLPEEKGTKTEGWIVFGTRLSSIMPCELKDGRMAALVEMKVKTPDGTLTMRLLDHQADAKSGEALLSVSIPEGYEHAEPLPYMDYSDEEDEPETDAGPLFDPEAYGQYLVPAESYPKVTAGYWKVWTVEYGQEVLKDELYTIPGKWRHVQTFDHELRSVRVVDSMIYWESQIEYEDEVFYVSRLESFYDSPANTNGEQKPYDYYPHRRISDLLREGLDFQVLPDTRDIGGITLLHVKLEQFSDGPVKGDGWLILQYLPLFDEFSSQEYVLKDGRKGYLIAYDYTEIYEGEELRYQQKMVYEPAKTVDGSLFSLVPPKGFEDGESWDFDKRPVAGEEALREREAYAQYLQPSAATGKVKANYWLVRDTNDGGEKEEAEMYTMPGKYRGTNIRYEMYQNWTVVVDSSVHWENFIDNEEKTFRFDRLESFYDSPANVTGEPKPDSHRTPSPWLEGDDFTLLSETRVVNGSTLRHVRIHKSFLGVDVAGDGWIILEKLPMFRYDDGLQLSDGRIGYLIEYDFSGKDVQYGYGEDADKEQIVQRWWKRRILAQEEGKSVDATLFSLTPPKDYTDENY